MIDGETLSVSLSGMTLQLSCGIFLGVAALAVGEALVETEVRLLIDARQKWHSVFASDGLEQCLHVLQQCVFDMLQIMMEGKNAQEVGCFKYW